jgi:hypothetical protein
LSVTYTSRFMPVSLVPVLSLTALEQPNRKPLLPQTAQTHHTGGQIE